MDKISFKNLIECSVHIAMYVSMKYYIDQKINLPKHHMIICWMISICRMLFSRVCSLMIINVHHSVFSMTNFLFTHDALLPFSHKSQKMEEQVEDIQIEVDRGHNVFLGRQFVHHHACIKDDEEREKESTPSCDHSVHQHSGEENLLK